MLLAGRPIVRHYDPRGAAIYRRALCVVAVSHRTERRRAPGCRRCVRARETVDTEGGSRVLICAETGKGPRERPDSEDDQLLGMALAVIGPLP
jgi:hypothetical protein